MPLYNDSIFEHRGYKFRVQFPHDPDMGPPWEEHDGHGPVSEWTTRDKKPGERVLATDGSHHRYYDFAEAVEIARRDGWGPGDRKPGETAEQATVRAVEEDYEHLRRWCADEWKWCGVVVTLCDSDGNPDENQQEALWGIEDDEAEYLEKVARELADEIHARIEVANPDVQRSEN